MIGADYDWRDDALCAQVGPDLFFPPLGSSARPARAICKACPVRLRCLDWSLSLEDDEFGILAGLSPSERAAIRAGKVSIHWLESLEVAS